MSPPRCPPRAAIPRLAVVLAGSLAATLACRAEVAPERPTHLVETGAIERIVIATGTIEPAVEVEVRPRIAGIVERIHVDEGEIVEKGQLLVEIERELLASQVREAKAALDASDVELRFAKIALDRVKELHDTKTASDQVHDDAVARYEQARAARARAKAAVDTLQTQLSYATLASSLRGRILEVHVEEGDAVSPVTSVTGGTLLLSIAGDETLHLDGLVDENEIARVALDQRARIRTEAYGERIFEGRVREIAPMGQRVQNVTYFEVEVEVVDPDAPLLRPRMSADAEIVTETVEGAVIVPETALRYRGDEILVDLAGGDDGAEASGGDRDEAGRVVEIGIIDGDRVQVLSGVAAGDRVLLQ